MNMGLFVGYLNFDELRYLYSQMYRCLLNEELLEKHEEYLDIVSNLRYNKFTFLDAEVVLACLEWSFKEKYEAPIHLPQRDALEALKSVLEQELEYQNAPRATLYKDMDDPIEQVTFLEKVINPDTGRKPVFKSHKRQLVRYMA